MRFLTIGILTFIGIAIFYKHNPVYSQTIPKSACFRDACVNLEIADTEEERQLGLMFREVLPQDSGMLFIFNIESKHGFWMKNMNFPIDIIWINQDKKIVEITKTAKPCSKDCAVIYPKSKVKYVLEVNPGFVDKNKIKIEEEVNFQ